MTQVIADLTAAIEAARRKQAEERARAKAQASKPDAPGQPPETGAAEAAYTPSGGGFSRLKGNMNLPVEGEITGKFGETRTDGTGPTWKGVFISAIEGQKVKAVAPGRVVFSEWLRGFGEIVIIDHGDQYLSVYGNNDKLLKTAGQTVESGEVIAEVGNSSGNLETGLYFELRHQGKPFNPMTWSRR
ncbi:MAG: peptidoglycan DD-metalloendopeptidase family protein [Limnobacter sp.]|nr:peptidoglycan DD-metalloendopeptidase family protein [Limnobacter sp.]